jgi:protein-disulfide isomerase
MAEPRKLDAWATWLIIVAALAVCVLGFTGYQQHAAFRVVQNDQTGIVYGNPKGTKIVVEFYDYQCPYCPQSHARFAEALKNNKDVKVIVRPFAALGPASQTLATYMLAAELQGKGVALHNKIVEQRIPVPRERFLELATEVGVDVARMQSDAENAALRQRIIDIEDAAFTIGIKAVPTYLLNRTIYVPVGDLPSVEEYSRLLKSPF